MALWQCAACTAAYAVGLPRCPQCGSPEREEEEAKVPKITRSGVSYEPGREPDGPDEHPGTGSEMEAAGHPADGSASPEVSSEPADDSHAEPVTEAAGPAPKPAPKRAPSAAKPADSADGAG